MEWQPIETYDALKKKPAHAVFYFMPSIRPRNSLAATIEMTRHFGNRKCTHWLQLPPTP